MAFSHAKGGVFRIDKYNKKLYNKFVKKLLEQKQTIYMEKIIIKMLQERNFACGAAARAEIAKEVENTIGLPKPRKLDLAHWADVIAYAIEVGGARHGTQYEYLNAQGGRSVAKVFDLYEIPEGLVNPFLVCFSGYMPAAFYTLEARRAYLAKYGKELPLVATGKGGNKGLFASVFNREEGVMVETEAEAYMRIMEQIIGSEPVRKYQRSVQDTDTKGNFGELYQLAKEQGLDEVTFILCSGQPWYTNRLLAEGMLEYGRPEYADVKVNLVVLDCPLTMSSCVPEGDLSELMLGYIAASLGPLTKDTTSLDAPDFSKERYLLPGVAEADWSVFEELIINYSNMGWPNYQELLYGIDHQTAVYNVIMADLYARASFTAEQYEIGIQADILAYKSLARRREKVFPRQMSLKIRWSDGYRYFTDYTQMSYLEYMKNRERMRDWRVDEAEVF